MPPPRRSEVIDYDNVGIYHCYNRCVRRAFLCGIDPVSGKDFRHRKDWIYDRLKLLAGSFAIDVIDFAELDNHLHTLLRIRPDVLEVWSDEEVARRWWEVCPERKDADGRALEPRQVELDQWINDPKKIKELRSRLLSLSWFMKLLCQNIATRANKEEGITGKFFESRFKCNAIEDQSALLACSMYLNLNVIRAGMALTPEDSKYTSVFDRIWAMLLTGEPFEGLFPCSREFHRGPYAEGAPVEAASPESLPDNWLSPVLLQEPVFDEDPSEEPQSQDIRCRMAMANHFPAPRASNKGYLAMTLVEYLMLLDWTGRQFREDKRGAIPEELAPILARLHIRSEKWLDLVEHFPQYFRTAAGSDAALRKEAQRRGRKWLHGVRNAAAVFR